MKVKNRLKRTQNPFIKSLCTYLLDLKVHSFLYIDFILGVGQIQCYKEIDKKHWSKLCEKIHELQDTLIIPKIVEKRRVGNYKKVLECLLLEQN